jgi:integrase
MLTLTIQAGLRVSELIALNTGDIQLGTGAHVRCEGKGRKQRTVPLTTPSSRWVSAACSSLASAARRGSPVRLTDVLARYRDECTLLAPIGDNSRCRTDHLDGTTGGARLILRNAVRPSSDP